MRVAVVVASVPVPPPALTSLRRGGSLSLTDQSLALPESGPAQNPSPAPPPASTTGNRPAPRPAPANQRPVQPPDGVTDPLARSALALVGIDEEAEVYWYAVINDPTIPAHERKDLIEDLNEDGISDPKHPTTDDLPVILRRLLIIETAFADAMDDVNADAFEEAYKDLINLADLAMGGGRLVR